MDIKLNDEAKQVRGRKWREECSPNKHKLYASFRDENEGVDSAFNLLLLRVWVIGRVMPRLGSFLEPIQVHGKRVRSQGEVV